QIRFSTRKSSLGMPIKSCPRFLRTSNFSSCGINCDFEKGLVILSIITENLILLCIHQRYGLIKCVSDQIKDAVHNRATLQNTTHSDQNIHPNQYHIFLLHFLTDTNRSEKL